MDNINNRIKLLETQRAWLKLEINSSYGISPNSIKSDAFFIRRDQITMELKKLHLIKNRKIKIDKILQRNEESMEV